MNADAPQTAGSGRFRLELVGWMAEALSCGEEAAACGPSRCLSFRVSGLPCP